MDRFWIRIWFSVFGSVTLVLQLLMHRFLLTDIVIESRGKAYIHTHTVVYLFYDM
jgi:hypothetical protein